jgi:hypothetical protein
MKRSAIWFGRAPNAAADVRRERQQLLSFLLYHGRIYSGAKHWTKAHACWLANQRLRDGNVPVGDRPTLLPFPDRRQGSVMIKTNDQQRPSSVDRSRAPPQ